MNPRDHPCQDSDFLSGKQYPERIRDLSGNKYSTYQELASSSGKFWKLKKLSERWWGTLSVFPRQEIIFQKCLNQLYMQVQTLRRSRENACSLKMRKEAIPQAKGGILTPGELIRSSQVMVIDILIPIEQEDPSSICGCLAYIKRM